ncbi:MAG: HNH endonuclease [Albidovulum sp.]|nr:HNH endonuclease [Albidovulum sp.]MDE0531066.1 HNH endonuclease [Albidovulum sp.]
MRVDYRKSLNRDTANLSSLSALVLNADYRPLSYFPLSLWSWQDSIKAAFLDRVDVVSEYDRVVRSPSRAIRVPSVVVLRNYVKPAKSAAFTRFNLFLRDEFACQYCGEQGELTFDHVVPRSKGGKTNWSNVVAACARCNHQKGARLISECGFRLRRLPYEPSQMQLLNQGRKFPPNHLHRSWVDFLYWDAKLEE